MIKIEYVNLNINFRKATTLLPRYAYKYYIRKNCKRVSNSYKYRDAAPNPTKLIEISPRDIEYLVRPNFHDRLFPYDTYILDGNWDLVNQKEPQLTPIEDYWRLQSLENRFNNNCEWEETELYNRWSPNWRQDRSHITIEDKCSDLDELYTQITNNGYQSQRELSLKAISLPLGEAHGGVSTFPEPEYHEICINIGRDGRLIFDEGRHRMCISYLSNVESIPVRVLVRHKEWQSIRTQIANADDVSDLGEEVKQYVNHPDVSALI